MIFKDENDFLCQKFLLSAKYNVGEVVTIVESFCSQDDEGEWMGEIILNDERVYQGWGRNIDQCVENVIRDYVDCEPATTEIDWKEVGF